MTSMHWSCMSAKTSDIPARSIKGTGKTTFSSGTPFFPRGADPILFETAGSDLQCAKIDAPWLAGRIRPAITWKWSESAEEMMVNRMVDSVIDVLKEHNVDKGKVGIDIMDMRAYQAFTNKGIIWSTLGQR